MDEETDYLNTPEARREVDRVALDLHDLAYAVRSSPAEMREYVGQAERIVHDLQALHERVGEP